jgi:hypothetical protein
MNSNRFRLLAGLAVVVALVGVVPASAAELWMSLQYAGSYTATFESTDYLLVDGAVVDAFDGVTVMPPGTVDPTDIHQFDIYYSVDPSSPPDPGAPNPAQGWYPENSLQRLVVDVVLGPGLQQEPAVPYSPNPDPQAYDPPPAGVTPGIPRVLYTENSDATGNLQRIIATTDAFPAYGRDPGEFAPSMLGSFYLNWDGFTSTSLSVQPAASEPTTPWALWSGGWIDTTSPYTHGCGTIVPMSRDTMSGSDWFDLVVPEPSSIALAILAAIGLVDLARRRGFRLVAALAMMAALVGVSSASAAGLQMSMLYAGSFTEAFEPTAYWLVDGGVVDPNDGVTPLPLSVVQPTDIHQFDIYYSVDPSSPPDPGAPNPAQGWYPENSLGALIVDVVLGDGLAPAAGLPYAPASNPIYDPPPAGPPGGSSRQLYADNLDDGDPSDLRRIMLLTDPLAAYGRDPGESAPELMGSFFVNWDAVTSTSLSVQPAASVPSDPWELWSGGWIDTTSPYTHSNGTIVPMGGTGTVYPETMFGSVNEDTEYSTTTGFDLPGDCCSFPPDAQDAHYLLNDDTPPDFMHPFTATGGTLPYEWSDLTFLMGFGGPGDSAMDGNGLFTWDMRGVPKIGYYIWSALVTDAMGLTDTAILIIEFPEPASIVLFGLAAIGLVGLVRRRG